MRHVYLANVSPPLPGDLALCGRTRKTIPLLDQTSNIQPQCPACQREIRRAAAWHPHAVGYMAEGFRSPV